MQKQLYTKNMVYGMTYRGDCVGTGKAVILHSEIRPSPRSPCVGGEPEEKSLPKQGDLEGQKIN
jgi:hypothetical protein